MTIYIVTVKTDNGGKAFLAHSSGRAVFADKKLAESFVGAVKVMLADTYGKEEAEWVPVELREQDVLEKPKDISVTSFIASLVSRLK